MTRFNPRPGHATGATWITIGTVPKSARFNPRPGHATGATFRVRRRPAPSPMFQSAPRSRDRGDCRQSAPLKARLGFQSAPRSRDRGDSCHRTDTKISVAVSIRAPVTRPGRLGGALTLGGISMFQSAPRSRDRGDFGRNKQRALRDKFQSAPRSRDRGDPPSARKTPSALSFNPRPGHATGATGA